MVRIEILLLRIASASQQGSNMGPASNRGEESSSYSKITSRLCQIKELGGEGFAALHSLYIYTCTNEVHIRKHLLTPTDMRVWK